MHYRVNIDYGLCTGCKSCVKTCILGVLEWLDNSPLVANPHSCNYCLECEKKCPVDAIKVTVS